MFHMRRSLITTTLAVTVLETGGLAAQTPARPPVKQGWEWTMDSVRSVVGAVRAGKSLKPKSWPGGARVAVLLSFDADNETIPLRFGEPTIGELSRGQYGARVGLRRVVSLLDRHSIPATFFIPAVSLMLSPEMADLIKRSGRHEFGVHGWIHERNAILPAAIERELVQRAVDTLTKLTGTRRSATGRRPGT
jgi:peptidoglycan-N-acetylglucosamine deacetylase